MKQLNWCASTGILLIAEFLVHVLCSQFGKTQPYFVTSGGRSEPDEIIAKNIFLSSVGIVFSWLQKFFPFFSLLAGVTGISSEDARDYNKLQKALLQRYDFPEQGYNKKCSKANPDGKESLRQLIVRIRNYFNKCVELSEVAKRLRV